MCTLLQRNRCGGLSAVRDWTDELSVGEQQRLSFARLIAHPVPLAFLDEATRFVISNYRIHTYTTTYILHTSFVYAM
jgi:vitamin B12/bleomycin/antimicrobial peptide transport system ATP-binding/permease protein